MKTNHWSLAIGAAILISSVLVSCKTEPDSSVLVSCKKEQNNSAVSSSIKAATLVAAVKADDFKASIGLNIHPENTGTGSRYGSWDSYKYLLGNLGIKNMRSTLTANNQSQRDRVNWLYTNYGIKTVLACDPRYGGTAYNCKQEIKNYYLNACLAAEGPNEYDATGGSWATTDRQYQIDLWYSIKGDGATSALTVLGPSLVTNSAANCQALGNIDSYCNAGSIHAYPGAYNPDETAAPYLSTHNTYVTPNNPDWCTETGYYVKTADPNCTWLAATSEFGNARTICRFFTEFWNAGYKKTFKYDLLEDDLLGTCQKGWGIVRGYDYAVMPAYTALKNFITLLADGGTTWWGPTGVNFTIGNRGNVQTLLLRKSQAKNNEFWLAIWNHADIWNGTDLYPTQTISITFNQALWEVGVYTPRTGTAQGTVYANHARTVPWTINNVVIPGEVLLFKLTQ